MKRSLCAALVAVSLLAAIAAAQEEPTQAMNEPTIGVPVMALCTEVQDREPVGEASSFAEDVGTVCCFTKITGVEGESAVTHVWYHGDEEMSRVELPVRAASWRTWSCKTIAPGASGTWRVEVLAADGSVLKSAEFTVGTAGGM
jgi:hypothetical protein